MVFTHRINLPPSAGCGCPPGTEPPVPASEVQALKVRLEILEELVKGLKEHCSGGCCPTAAQAGTGEHRWGVGWQKGGVPRMMSRILGMKDTMCHPWSLGVMGAAKGQSQCKHSQEG